MKKTILAASSMITLLLLACGGASTSTTKNDTVATAMSADTLTSKTYDIALVNNKKDPTCGMPVTAGIGDTAHYENKVIGFCSTECKNEFLKNPAAGIAAAEIK